MEGGGGGIGGEGIRIFVLGPGDCFLLHTAFTTGELVKVRPTKIVAGHEAEKTNEFLQILSIAILKEVHVLSTIIRPWHIMLKN